MADAKMIKMIILIVIIVLTVLSLLFMLLGHASGGIYSESNFLGTKWEYKQGLWKGCARVGNKDWECDENEYKGQFGEDTEGKATGAIIFFIISHICAIILIVCAVLALPPIGILKEIIGGIVVMAVAIVHFVLLLIGVCVMQAFYDEYHDWSSNWDAGFAGVLPWIGFVFGLIAAIIAIVAFVLEFVVKKVLV